MILMRSIFGAENAIKIPQLIYHSFHLEGGDLLSVSVSRKNLLLTKTWQKGSVANITITRNLEIILPDLFVKTLGLKIGGEVFLSLKGEVLTLYASNIIDMNSQEFLANRLMKKLTAEFERKNHPSFGAGYASLLEDLYNFLLLEEWDNDIINRLLQRPNILSEILIRVRDDEAFDNMFEHTMRNKIIEYAME